MTSDLLPPVEGITEAEIGSSSLQSIVRESTNASDIKARFASASGEVSVRYLLESEGGEALHTHAEFELVVPLAADGLCGRYEHSGATCHIEHQSGTVHLIEAQQPHAFSWRWLEMVSFLLTKRTLESVAEDILERPISLSYWFEIDDALLPRLGSAVRDTVVEQGYVSRIFVESTCYVAAGQLVQRMGRRSSAARLIDLPDPRVRAACDLINERLGDDLTLTGLADAVGLSAFHFLRTFRAAIGTTPQRYILNQRLERARERLARTSATISRIASDLAFASPSHLASAFRVRFGLTPSEYRRSFGTIKGTRPIR